VQLSAARRTSAGRLFAGYNRPYSAAVQAIREQVALHPQTGGYSLNYFISGHLIPADHWYRHPDEGTRVCGNLGHWIDLTVHIWQWRGLPDWIRIQIAYANPDEPDDNICLTFTTDRFDMVSIMLTARTEPFEGINESINLQFGNIIARIDDFRALTLWRGSTLIHRQYNPKDVGHKRAVLQPYYTDNRDWDEVSLSTLLMLQIKDMVIARQTIAHFDVPNALTRLESDIQQALTTPVPIHQL
jgi:predicted dehydrogenase